MEWDLKPARDLNLSPAERLRSPVRERSLGGLAISGAWRAAIRTHLRVFHHFAVEGLANVPAAPPFVMVANHTSHLDALVLSSVLRGPAARRAYALAAGDTFFTNPAASMFAAYAVNALPVWRTRASQRGMLTLRERLIGDGLAFILFPEGTRSRTGTLGAFRAGIGLLVAGTQVPVVPCHIDGAFACWPAARRWPRPGRIRMRIGAPLLFADTANDGAGWTHVSEICGDAVRALAPAREGEG